MANFERVKSYLQDLNYEISAEDVTEEIIIINDLDNGINNLIIDCEFPILIIEQHLFNMPNDNLATYKQLLIKNRDIVHGAFVLDETGQKVLFRDTLQLSNLDLNELEASINSLSLLLSEYYTEIINFSKS